MMPRESSSQHRDIVMISPEKRLIRCFTPWLQRLFSSSSSSSSSSLHVSFDHKSPFSEKSFFIVHQLSGRGNPSRQRLCLFAANEQRTNNNARMWSEQLPRSQSLRGEPCDYSFTVSREILLTPGAETTRSNVKLKDELV